MILAAGLGTRLRPLTEDRPKALVEVGGVPMIERVARRLVEAGADRLIVNVHHHAAAIERHLAETEYGAEVRISRETERPLGTGGGIVHAAPHFRRDRPFLVHNVDVISEIDLRDLYSAHRESDAVATLAVHRRETDRTLLFDARGLYGWENAATGESETVRGALGESHRWPFAGVHAISPRFFDLVGMEGAFSIVAAYLRLAEGGHRIAARDTGGASWLEVGSIDRLARAREILADRP